MLMAGVILIKIDFFGLFTKKLKKYNAIFDLIVHSQ
jgi:hypothetical protein